MTASTPHPPYPTLAIYCGSSFGADPAIAPEVDRLGRWLGANGYRLVFGGGNVGLMGTIADAFLAAGAPVTGVIPRSLVDREMAHHGLTHLEVVDTMAQRKTRMEQLADAFVALPGGMGTLEELFEVFTLQQLGQLSGPVCLYSIGGFWQPMVDTLAGLVDAGFVQRKFLDALIVVDTPEGLDQALRDWRAPGAKW